MTTPPSQDPISQIYLSDSFYTWYKKTNDLITKVNPIEVYSITADVAPRDGVILSDDGDGNWTIGYVLPDNVTGGHTFEGDILFAAGVSGNIVNQYNGLTGNVSGVSTISNTYTPDGSGNVVSVPMVINGVTASTGGSMTLDASDIPNTIASITGPAGYVIVSSGPTMDSVTQLFNTQPGETQEGLNINPVTNRVVVGGNVYSSNHALRVDGRSGGIEIFTVTTEANSIDLDQSGTIKSDDSLYIMSGIGSADKKIVFKAGVDGATQGASSSKTLATLQYDVSGSTSGVLDITNNITKCAISTSTGMNNGDGPHDLSMRDRGSIHADTGIYFVSPNDSTGATINNNDISLFHFGHGDTFGNAETVFAIGENGKVGLRGGVGGIDYGTLGHILTSGGGASGAYWSDPDTGGGGGGGGGGDAVQTNIASDAVLASGSADITRHLQINPPASFVGKKCKVTLQGYGSGGGDSRSTLWGWLDGSPTTSDLPADTNYVKFKYGNRDTIPSSADADRMNSPTSQEIIIDSAPATTYYHVKSDVTESTNPPVYYITSYIWELLDGDGSGGGSGGGIYWEQVSLDKSYDIFNDMSEVTSDLAQDGTTQEYVDSYHSWSANSNNTGIPTDATHVLLTCLIQGYSSSAEDRTEQILCNPGTSSNSTNRHHIVQVTERAVGNADYALGFNHYWMPVDSSGNLYFNLGAGVTYAKVLVTGYAHYVNGGGGGGGSSNTTFDYYEISPRWFSGSSSNPSVPADYSSDMITANNSYLFTTRVLTHVNGDPGGIFSVEFYITHNNTVISNSIYLREAYGFQGDINSSEITFKVNIPSSFTEGDTLLLEAFNDDSFEFATFDVKQDYYYYWH